MSKRFVGGIIGYKDKTSPWHLFVILLKLLEQEQLLGGGSTVPRATCSTSGLGTDGGLYRKLRAHFVIIVFAPFYVVP